MKRVYAFHLNEGTGGVGFIRIVLMHCGWSWDWIRRVTCLSLEGLWGHLASANPGVLYLGNEHVSFLLLGFLEWSRRRWEKLGRWRGWGVRRVHPRYQNRCVSGPALPPAPSRDTRELLAGVGSHLSLVQPTFIEHLLWSGHLLHAGRWWLKMQPFARRSL